ncbi:MAG: copper homeostasis protein CutC, partial [Muribaculaceae bacterium]|nr:copper homeostasis protein CutC [Muribaculaceae bacterium]
MEGKKLEICTGDPAGVLAALQGGADRVELCSGLAEGGLTPSAGAIRFASELMPVNVLIRPRAGDFVYTPEEIAVMECDIEEAVKSGVC